MWVFLCVCGNVEPDLLDPVSCQVIPLAAAHALAFQSERDIPQYRTVVERCVILKHHAPICGRTCHRLAKHQHVAASRRMLRFQAPR